MNAILLGVADQFLKPVARGCGCNVLVVSLVHIVTSDLRWMPGVPQVASFVFATLAACAGYLLVRRLIGRTMAKAPGRRMVLAMLTFISAALSLIVLRHVHHHNLIIPDPRPLAQGEVVVPPAETDKEGRLVVEPPFIKPLFTPSSPPSNDPSDISASPKDYIKSLEGGWKQAVEQDRRTLEDWFGPGGPFSYLVTATQVAFQLAYFATVLPCSVGFAFLWPDDKTTRAPAPPRQPGSRAPRAAARRKPAIDAETKPQEPAVTGPPTGPR